jgi:hypothetical protein
MASISYLQVTSDSTGAANRFVMLAGGGVKGQAGDSNVRQKPVAEAISRDGHT